MAFLKEASLKQEKPFSPEDAVKEKKYYPREDKTFENL
jgi:hypothetical protein